MVWYLTHEILYRHSKWGPLTVSDKRVNHITTLNITYFAMQNFDGRENRKNSVILSHGATLLTFEVLEVTNINILLTISKYNHEKCFENKKMITKGKMGCSSIKFARQIR